MTPVTSDFEKFRAYLLLLAQRQIDPRLPADQSSPSQRAAREEEAIRLSAALSELSDPQREAIVLQHWHGMKISEIGANLEKSPAAVADLLKRGLARLREILDEK